MEIELNSLDGEQRYVIPCPAEHGFFLFLKALFWFESQSTSIVMSRRSVIKTTLIRGQA